MKILIFLFLSVLLSGCAMSRVELIATKSYQLGCIDRGNGGPVDSFNCLKASKRFQKRLHAAWAK